MIAYLGQQRTAKHSIAMCKTYPSHTNLITYTLSNDLHFKPNFGVIETIHTHTHTHFESIKRAKRYSNTDDPSKFSIVNDHICESHNSAEATVSVYTGNSVDNRMSGGHHRCMRLVNVSRLSCLRDVASSDQWVSSKYPSF